MNDIGSLFIVGNRLIDSDRIKRDFGSHLDALLSDSTSIYHNGP